MRKNIVASLCCVAILAVLPASALAFERSLQDDQTFVYDLNHDRDRRLAEFRAVGGTHIRINLLHARGDEPLDSFWGSNTGGDSWGLSDHAGMSTYDAAVDVIRAAGFKVQMTLVWYGQSDPQALAEWMGRVARHFAGRVDRFSILNEPDATLHDVDACDPRTIRQMIAEGTLKTKRVRKSVYRRLSVKRLRKFKGVRYRQIKRRTSTGKRVIAYKRSRKGRYRRKRKWRQVALAGVSTRQQESVSIAVGCLRIRQGQKYRQIVQAAAPVIRDAAPSAEVMAGETSSGSGSLLFISAATRDGLPVDGWLHHPYDGKESGIYNGAAVQEAARMPVGYSEFGYDVTWPDRADALRRAWHQSIADGVFQMSQYGYNTPLSGTWNTSLGGDASLLAYIMR